VILILSHAEDAHACAVEEALNRRGAPSAIVNLADFPQRLQLQVSYDGCASRRFVLRHSTGVTLDLDECHAIWWRRPQLFTLHPEVRDPVMHSFALTEASEAFGGLWLALDAFWMNHPTSDADAHRKLHQLRIAQDVGLTIPETLITNAADEALAFVHRMGVGRTIYKAFSGTEQAWRETRLVKDEELVVFDAVRYAPVIFQEYIDAECDLRITIVGGRLFAAAIRSQQSAYRIDFRMDMARTPIEPYELPREVEHMLLELMRRLDIVYGAVDMRLMPDGRYVFLEVNPAGQWLFVEHRSGLPITEAVAETLASAPQRAGQRRESGLAASIG
jgi:glutathione synthase/RimK-type ligase-like ATP-grasp enzyme